jgi:hypothetical protein
VKAFVTFLIEVCSLGSGRVGCAYWLLEAEAGSKTIVYGSLAFRACR